MLVILVLAVMTADLGAAPAKSNSHSATGQLDKRQRKADKREKKADKHDRKAERHDSRAATALDRLQKRLDKRYAQGHERALRWAERHGAALRESNDGVTTELVFVRGNTPFTRITTNAPAADSISADELWSGGSLGLDLSGAGVRLHAWDAGEVRAGHLELVGAVTWADDSSPGLSDHATHVAGSMVAMGANAAARGMAPGATLDAYDWANDDAEMAAAAASGARVSSHGYAWVRGWHQSPVTGDWYWYGDPDVSPDEDALFGFYDATARAWDDIAFHAPHYLIVRAAGNDRGTTHDGEHFIWSNGHGWQWSDEPRQPDGGATGYDTLDQQACAKNILTVGAVEDVPGGYWDPSSVMMTGFSGWGPSDDGRIKPDIVANGWEVLSASAGGDVDYAVRSGTSMSAATAAGALGLLIEDYRATHDGADLTSAALKGLVIHTADECGDDPGPDYRFGWGLLNAKTAAELIELDASSPDSIRELTIEQGGTVELSFPWTGGGPFKATMCWTDHAGSPVERAVDPPDRMLVNDLDLRIVAPDGTIHEPWALDPASPAAAAVRGDNDRDNVEMVLVDAAAAGTYTIRITHKGTLKKDRQDFALVVGAAPQAPACPPDHVLDCNGDCVPVAWIGDGVCHEQLDCIEFDFDGGDCAVTTLDDHPYIQWRHTGTGQNAVWYMDAETTLPESGSLPYAALVWTMCGTGDFDGDVHRDILWRHSDSGADVIWFTDGATLTPVTLFTQPVGDTGWSVAGVEDFDVDGKADILWRHAITGQVAIWFMDGITVRPETGELPPVSLGWGIEGAADFDGDGDPDVLWRNPATGENAVWFLEGTSLVPAVQPAPEAGAAWRVAGLDDFDGDGMADILWRHTITGQVAVWFMDGAALRPETGVPATVGDLSWSIAGTGDFDGDGLADVVWRHLVTGENVMWLMQGTSLKFEVRVMTTVADTGWTIVDAGG